MAILCGVFLLCVATAYGHGGSHRIPAGPVPDFAKVQSQSNLDSPAQLEKVRTGTDPTAMAAESGSGSKFLNNNDLKKASIDRTNSNDMTGITESTNSDVISIMKDANKAMISRMESANNALGSGAKNGNIVMENVKNMKNINNILTMKNKKAMLSIMNKVSSATANRMTGGQARFNNVMRNGGLKKNNVMNNVQKMTNRGMNNAGNAMKRGMYNARNAMNSRFTNAMGMGMGMNNAKAMYNRRMNNANYAMNMYNSRLAMNNHPSNARRAMNSNANFAPHTTNKAMYNRMGSDKYALNMRMNGAYSRRNARNPALGMNSGLTGSTIRYNYVAPDVSLMTNFGFENDVAKQRGAFLYSRPFPSALATRLISGDAASNMAVFALNPTLANVMTLVGGRLSENGARALLNAQLGSIAQDVAVRSPMPLPGNDGRMVYPLQRQQRQRQRQRQRQQQQQQTNALYSAGGYAERPPIGTNNPLFNMIMAAHTLQ